MDSMPPGILWLWWLIKSIAATWLAITLIIELWKLRKESLRVAEAQRIMDQGGPKTIPEALFLFPSACSNCGYTKWICRSRWGYHRHMVDLDEPADRPVRTEVTDEIVLVDRECVRCGYQKPDPEMLLAYGNAYHQMHSRYRSDEELDALLQKRGAGIWFDDGTLEVTEESVSAGFLGLRDREIPNVPWSPDQAAMST